MAAPNRIETLRKIARLSHADLASRMDVSESTARRWENSQVQIPDEQKLALARLFEVSVPFLMGWPEPNDDETKAA